MAVRSYQELIAWQKAITLVTDVYRLTRGFPKDEVYGLTSQVRRVAVSIPSNIAEGQGRLSRGEFKQFLGTPEDRSSNLKVRSSSQAISNISHRKKLDSSTKELQSWFEC